MEQLRTVDVVIAGIKEPDYPSHYYRFQISDAQDLIIQADNIADELNFSKNAIYIDKSSCLFTDEEIEYLIIEGCEFN
jgi:hypothetical protein